MLHFRSKAVENRLLGHGCQAVLNKAREFYYDSCVRQEEEEEEGDSTVVAWPFRVFQPHFPHSPDVSITQHSSADEAKRRGGVVLLAPTQ